MHGRKVRVMAVDPAFNLAPPDYDPCEAEVIFVSPTGAAASQFGIGRERIAGTPQNARLRAEEAVDDGRQGSLLL